MEQALAGVVHVALSQLLGGNDFPGPQRRRGDGDRDERRGGFCQA